MMVMCPKKRLQPVTTCRKCGTIRRYRSTIIRRNSDELQSFNTFGSLSAASRLPDAGGKLPELEEITFSAKSL